MSEPFLAEVRMVGFNFAPRGWAFCDGQILPINQNQSLYSLLGTTYGGDGRTSFALPDLRGRTPVHVNSAHPLGQKSGEENNALTIDSMPTHRHSAYASSKDSTVPLPSGNVLSKSSLEIYSDLNTNVSMSTQSISNTGDNQAHENMQPSLAVNFCIALQGLFPSRN